MEVRADEMLIVNRKEVEWVKAVPDVALPRSSRRTSVGYSRLMETDEAGTLGRSKALRRDIIDPSLALHSGRIVKLMGDGALVEFASAVEAVISAVEIQRKVREHNSEAGDDAIIGSASASMSGTSSSMVMIIYGDGVNVAARLEALAEPGGVLYLAHRPPTKCATRLPISIRGPRRALRSRTLRARSRCSVS